jgi:hypothetical protein
LILFIIDIVIIYWCGIIIVCIIVYYIIIIIDVCVALTCVIGISSCMYVYVYVCGGLQLLKYCVFSHMCGLW